VAFETHPKKKKLLTVTASSLWSRSSAECPQKEAPTIDPLIRVERELKTAEEFFQLAKNANSPFMRAYCRRIAERYLCESKSLTENKSI
jgi:hypothetical protein